MRDSFREKMNMLLERKEAKMIKQILFDFDGVIIDSMPIKTEAFRKILQNFDPVSVDKLVDYHNLNGGLSRYVKLHYFFQELLSTPVTEEEIYRYANQFSKIVKEELSNKSYLISEVVQFLKENQSNYSFHIVSGADETELKYLCEKLEIRQYFQSIHGSPTHKNELVKQVLAENHYEKSETILIGDSINDHEAAEVNEIGFYAYNNPSLKPISKNYLESIKDLV